MINNEFLTSLVPLGLAFIAYFVTHSLLASLSVKRWARRRYPQLMHVYRLSYNILAILLLIPLLWFMRENSGPLVWQWTGILAWIMKSLTVTAILGFVWSLKSYDNMIFLGITQWRNRHTDINDPEHLSISTLHRFVRHPWYFFFIVILWSQNLHLAQLIVYSLITLYFVIGSRLEERKLIVHYGAAYKEYIQKVPGLIPLPWRWLNKEEAGHLEKRAADLKTDIP